MKKPLMTLGVEEKPEMKSPIDSLIVDLILEHFNIQSTMGRQQVLSGRDFDRIVDEAEEVWLQEIMIKEGGASA